MDFVVVDIAVVLSYVLDVNERCYLVPQKDNL